MTASTTIPFITILGIDVFLKWYITYSDTYHVVIVQWPWVYELPTLWRRSFKMPNSKGDKQTMVQLRKPLRIIANISAAINDRRGLKLLSESKFIEVLYREIWHEGVIRPSNGDWGYGGLIEYQQYLFWLWYYLVSIVDVDILIRLGLTLKQQSTYLWFGRVVRITKVLYNFAINFKATYLKR